MEPVLDDGAVELGLAEDCPLIEPELVAGLVGDWSLVVELLEVLEGDVVLDWLLVEGELWVAWLLLLLLAGALEVVLSCCATAQAAESNRSEVVTILFRMR